jgi:YesN/AraC family two-component response regulator
MKSRARILVVDDEELLRKMVRNILVRVGYGSVKCASDGDAALEKLSKRRYHIMITDIRMPEMSGLELLVKVRDLYPELAVVVMTGFGDLHTPEEARNLGAAEYITKPFKASEIEVIVERVRMQQITGFLRSPSPETTSA